MAYYVESSVREPRLTSKICSAFKICIVLVLFDSGIELMLSSMAVAWVKNTDYSSAFRFTADGKKYPLSGHPRHFAVDHVHVTQAAAMFATLFPGLTSGMALMTRDSFTGRGAKPSRYFYYIWLSLCVPALILTGVALTYALAVENSQKAQVISTALAISENGRPYARGTWTPLNWFAAVLKLDSFYWHDGRADMVNNLNFLRGALYNLIPMFILQLAQLVLAFIEYYEWVREPSLSAAYSGY
ncbi:hypothetical protein F5X97DRAFT_345633 [Nemania serpens]|nr:hypothetical protein F5X97DRAFT_345633 [Nemania serpens]